MRSGEGLCVIDATWYLPNSPYAAPPGSPGVAEEYRAGPRLPGARFFDIAAVSAAHPKGLKNMLPDEAMLSSAMASLGVDRSTRIVVYDRHGVFSSPRLWYTLRVAFDHPAPVAVLDGGLPRWQELGYPLETGPPPDTAAAGATWRRRPGSSWDLEEVRANIHAREALVLDARAAARFEGSAPEGPGARPGHIPGSCNIPFSELLTAPPRRFRPEAELREAFRRAGASEVFDGRPRVVTTCGSGMTACIVGLAMHLVGLPLEQWALYDGSWSEWGTAPDTPVEVGKSAAPRRGL